MQQGGGPEAGSEARRRLESGAVHPCRTRAPPTVRPRPNRVEQKRRVSEDLVVAQRATTAPHPCELGTGRPLPAARHRAGPLGRSSRAGPAGRSGSRRRPGAARGRAALAGRRARPCRSDDQGRLLGASGAGEMHRRRSAACRHVRTVSSVISLRSGAVVSSAAAIAVGAVSTTKRPREAHRRSGRTRSRRSVLRRARSDVPRWSRRRPRRRGRGTGARRRRMHPRRGAVAAQAAERGRDRRGHDDRVERGTAGRACVRGLDRRTSSRRARTAAA